MEWIEEHYDGTRPDGTWDSQTAIRNCIRDYYEHHGTHWVCLGGDDNIIPIRYALGTNKDDARPAELYYSDTDGGSWDLDADGIYGEAGDVTQVELTPDVCLGRISVRDAQQAEDYVRKVGVFEDTPTASFPYGSLFVTGGDESSHLAIVDYRRPLGDVAPGPTYSQWYWQKIQPEWQSIPMHELYSPYTSWDENTHGDYQAGVAHLVDRLNEGNYQFIYYSGHGSVPWWFLEESVLWPSDALGLTNQVPFILRSGGCWTGAFDQDDTCITEAYLRSPLGGAIVATAYAGATDSNSYHQDGIYEEMFARDIRNLGEAFTLIKQLTASSYDTASQCTYVFLGDPAIDRRVDQPGRNLQVFLPDAMEFYDHGDAITIRWNAAGTAFAPEEQVRLEYSGDSGVTWQTIPGAEAVAYNATAFTWQDHGLPVGDHYRVRVVSLADPSVASMSRLDFRVVHVGLTDGEFLAVGRVGHHQPESEHHRLHLFAADRRLRDSDGAGHRGERQTLVSSLVRRQRTDVKRHHRFCFLVHGRPDGMRGLRLHRRD